MKVWPVDGGTDGPSAEVDPLQDFFAERPVEPTHVPESKRDDRAGPIAVAADDPTADVVHRLERAERLLDRSLIGIAALKSDLATLVGAVEDIKRRQSRNDPPPAPPPPPAKRMSPWRAVVAAVVLLTFATLAWALATIVSQELPEASPIESRSEPEPVAVPAPVVEVVPAPVEIQNAATVSVTPAAAPAPPPRLGSRPVTGYVGTLMINASPAGTVFLNRKDVGRTPLRLEALRAGSHLIWIEREGYRRWTRVVAVVADRVSHVSADLAPIAR